MARSQFEVAGRKGTARAIKAFRTAMRAGDCRRASIELETVETGYARRSTKWQLTDQFVLACGTNRGRR